MAEILTEISDTDPRIPPVVARTSAETAGADEPSDKVERMPLTAEVLDNPLAENDDSDRETQGQTLEEVSDNKTKTMENFEIEDVSAENGEVPNILQQISEDLDDLDEEAQGLLAESPASEQAVAKMIYCCFWVGPVEHLGNCTIFLPTVFARSGWGIMGPHWFGPPCVLGVLLSACSFFIRHAFYRVGPITGFICILWTGIIIILLGNSAYRDPGIVRQGQESPTKNHRWCELCKNYQPPKGAHCPDCNVCIAGFDQYVLRAKQASSCSTQQFCLPHSHTIVFFFIFVSQPSKRCSHCVWMGCCIGRSNLKHFTLFNISWLLFLGYCIAWVSILGPIIFHHKNH